MPERGFIIKLSVIILAIFGLFTICFAMGLLSKSIWLSAIKKPIIFSQPIATILSSNNNPSPTPPGPSSNPTLLTPATEVLIERTQVTSAQNTPNPDEPIGTPDEPIGTPINTPTLIASPTVTIGSINFDSWCIPWHTEASRGKVIRIIDGITIEVEIDGDPFIVRYIGLDLPSPDFHAQSLETNAELVFNGEILLVKDRSEMDEEGRLLRYVIAGGVFINQAIANQGYAQVRIVPPDSSCEYLLNEAVTSAMDNQIGMWAPRPTPSRPVIFHPTATVSNSGELIITSVQPKGVGWQDPEEYVEIRNTSAFPIQLKGWRLSDLKGHAFNFVDFIINPGNYCRIYTNAYHPEHCGLSFYSLSPVWNEPQDCVLLFNAYGNLVDQYCYGW